MKFNKEKFDLTLYMIAINYPEKYEELKDQIVSAFGDIICVLLEADDTLTDKLASGGGVAAVIESIRNLAKQ